MSAGGVVLFAWTSRRRQGLYDTTSSAHDTALAGSGFNPFTAGYPVALTAHLDPRLSRWQ